MNKFNLGVVIPATEDRQGNLYRVLNKLVKISDLDDIVVVCDGWNDLQVDFKKFEPKVKWVWGEKYFPSAGMEQPRNVGVNFLEEETNFVWFLDSDVIPDIMAYYEYEVAHAMHNVDAVMIGPYDWMPDTNVDQSIKNDPRWEMFQSHDSAEIKYNDLGYGLGCFSGNLVWPVKEFKLIGGFWNELNMGRCEDGELGIRAASLGVPMSVVSRARGYHLHHERNEARIFEANERDVPLIHSRHGKLEDTGLKVVNEDGKRFNYVCPDCGEEFNTLMYWSHECTH